MEEAGKGFLKGFNFNIKAILSSIFFAQYALDSTTGEVTVTGLNPINDVVAPGGATHMAMKAGWANVNFETGVFDTKISNAETFPIDATVQDLSLQFAAPPEGDGCGFHLLHIEFYQEVNSNYYVFAQGNAMKISELF